MKLNSMLWAGVVALASTPILLFAHPDCDGTAPGSSKPCGSENSCKNKQFTNHQNPPSCASTFIKRHSVVNTCDGEGSCSTSCGSFGLTTCTESFECDFVDVTEDGGSPPIFTLECAQGDAVLDPNGVPVTSTTTKKGYVSCHDACGA